MELATIIGIIGEGSVIAGATAIGVATTVAMYEVLVGTAKKIGGMVITSGNSFWRRFRAVS